MLDYRPIVNSRPAMRFLGDLQGGIDSSNANKQIQRSRGRIGLFDARDGDIILATYRLAVCGFG